MRGNTHRTRPLAGTRAWPGLRRAARRSVSAAGCWGRGGRQWGWGRAAARPQISTAGAPATCAKSARVTATRLRAGKRRRAQPHPIQRSARPGARRRAQPPPAQGSARRAAGGGAQAGSARPAQAFGPGALRAAAVRRRDRPRPAQGSVRPGAASAAGEWPSRGRPSSAGARGQQAPGACLGRTASCLFSYRSARRTVDCRRSRLGRRTHTRPVGKKVTENRTWTQPP